MSSQRIGIFDSGIGGLSVLAAVHAHLPSASLHYIADSGHAPYGERSDAHVLERSHRIASKLVDAGAQAVVIACNTATAIAADSLRACWPRLPIIGVEPGLKPAVAASRTGRIGVMATSATLRSARFQRLLAAHCGGASVHLRACTGLAAAIEAGQLDDTDLRALVERHCRPLVAAGVDTVVLGCTHYVFTRSLIQAAIGPNVVVIDTADAIARQVATVTAGLPSGPCAGSAIHLQTSGKDVVSLRRIARQWLGLEVDVSPSLDATG